MPYHCAVMHLASTKSDMVPISVVQSVFTTPSVIVVLKVKNKGVY